MLDLQDLREALAEDYFLYEQEASCGVVFYSEVGYAVVEYSHCGSRTAIEPINLAHIRDLNGYVLIFRNGEFEHEIEGDLYESSSQAVDRVNITVALCENES
ncbi:hypothetical protein [Salmonella enterica]|uniref:hypothetical protein n=1 Tax=Salmonella enterica TaxID=28901 RepID=UPI003F30CD21